MTANDDNVLLALILRLALAHVKIAEESLAGLRGRGRGQFMDERRAELDAIKVRLAKAATVQANEGTLDRAHALMRDIERVHDSIVAAVTDAEAEMSRWRGGERRPASRPDAPYLRPICAVSPGDLIVYWSPGRGQRSLWE